MPVPGPRNQFGPVEGYRNPSEEQSHRFNHWNRPGPVWWPGRTPGLMQITLRGCVLGYGQIRRLWRQSVNFIPGQAPYSWTNNGNTNSPSEGVGITRALRYMTRSVYAAGGTDNTRFYGTHTDIARKVNYKTVTVQAGNVRSRPTVRNRMTSFGSRVPTLNSVATAAEQQKPGNGQG